MYTTVAYRAFRGEGSIDDLSMSEGAKEEKISSSVEWIAFKQQFFSSVLIARDDFLYADVAHDTASPDSGLIKAFSAAMAVPYTAQTEQYDFSFYFGPNKYAVLKKIDDAQGRSLLLDRLIPMGWGIIGWVSRWLVIPVFDFLPAVYSELRLDHPHPGDPHQDDAVSPLTVQRAISRRPRCASSNPRSTP